MGFSFRSIQSKFRIVYLNFVLKTIDIHLLIKVSKTYFCAHSEGERLWRRSTYGDIICNFLHSQ